MKLTYAGIFLEGLLSFLSPCVLPLLPVYMAYLSGNADEEGEVRYKRKDVFLNTLFFVLGISLTFVLLAISIEYIRQFIEDYKEIIGIIGGTLIILFGLHECGVLNISLLDRNVSLKEKLNLKKMSFLKAFLFGFLFSFAWSPCIGPMMANALLLASTEAEGWLYLLFYALGLVIPFLLCGVFTTAVLNFFQTKKKLLRYVLCVSGVILIAFGSYMIYTNTKSVLSYKHPPEETVLETNDVVFFDQNGERHRLRDDEGKYIYLNFVASWCTYCRQEIPYYLEFDAAHEDIVCYYVMSPLVSNEGSIDYIKSYVFNNDMSKLPVLLDEEGRLFREFGVSSFPTLFVIDPDGDVLGYASGMNDTEGFEAIYEKAKEMFEEKE